MMFVWRLAGSGCKGLTLLLLIPVARAHLVISRPRPLRTPGWRRRHGGALIKAAQQRWSNRRPITQVAFDKTVR
ncbi:hypothetical protein KCP69_04520 [Salmonella enterica subsp. enterica]|nr:hypothetical protein KCP69_04520 [Salmonella enterica subsp. enterica]